MGAFKIVASLNTKTTLLIVVIIEFNADIPL